MPDSDSAGEKPAKIAFFVDKQDKVNWVRSARSRDEKLQDWVIASLNAAVQVDDMAQFELEFEQGTPVLVGAGFRLPFPVDKGVAQEFVSFLNIALNRSDSDRMRNL